MNENEIAQQIVHAALRVHMALGPGLLESVHQAALAYANWKSGDFGVPSRRLYVSVRIETGFHAVLVVENKVIVEIKVVQTAALVLRHSRE